MDLEAEEFDENAQLWQWACVVVALFLAYAHWKALEINRRKSQKKAIHEVLFGAASLDDLTEDHVWQDPVLAASPRQENATPAAARRAALEICLLQYPTWNKE